MQINDVFDLSIYDEAYKFVTENDGTTIKYLGSGQYQIIEIPEVDLTIEEQNEAIRATREQLYQQKTDGLTLRKLRKQSLGTWTQEDEAEYVQLLKDISKQINAENPYLEEANNVSPDQEGE